jgi:hypothetical protein
MDDRRGHGNAEVSRGSGQIWRAFGQTGVASDAPKPGLVLALSLKLLNLLEELRETAPRT